MRIALTTRPNPDSLGAVPLYVRIAHGAKDRYVALGLRVQPRDWNAKRSEVRKSHPDSHDFQAKLAGRLRLAEKAATAELNTRGRNATADHLKEAVVQALHPPTRQPTAGVVAYGRTLQNGKRAAGKIGNANVYGTALRHFEDTLRLEGMPGADIAFEDLSPALLRRHEERLNALSYKQNYIAKQLRTLRAIVRRADAESVPGATAAAAAVKTIKARTERVEKPRLSLDEVRKMEALVGTVTGRRADVLDWWIFAFYAGGMRFGDVISLRWSGIEWDGNPGTGGRAVYVRWRMQKTGDAAGVPLLPAVSDVLSRWWERTGREPFVFGGLTSEQARDPAILFKRTASLSALARKELKTISEKAGVSYVGFHGARHSLADILRKQGVPVATIQQILGHSSIQVTQNYLSGFDRDAVDEALRSLG